MKKTRKRFVGLGLVTVLGVLYVATPSFAGKPSGGGGGGGARASVDLAVTMTDSPDPVSEGAELTYAISVANKGKAGATGVTLSDPISAQVVSVDSSQGSCDQSVACSLGSVAAGGSASVTIVVRANAQYPQNTASVSSTEADKNSANNTVTVTTTIEVPPPPPPPPGEVDLSISITDSPDPYLAVADLADGTADGITYLVSVTNLSDTAAKDVQANLLWIERELVFREANSSEATCGPVGPSGFEGVLETRCVIPILGPGQSVQIALRAEVCLAASEGGTDFFAWVGYLGGHAQGDYPENDPDWGNNDAHAFTITAGGTQTSCPS